MPHTPVELFYSYSHRDEKLRDELQKHLSLLKRQGYIADWHDRCIAPGDEWKSSINEHLEAASIILLLISANFIASDYCHDIEMRRAMKRNDDRTARVIPVILSPCDWKSARFGTLQAVPTDGKPVTLWNSQDEAFENIATAIRNSILTASH